ncbi:MAG TPA: hypothetical protein VFR34_11990, partial [Paracoccaceae bacterium]|nr:hypothetical protein [Paracoccaceae bacterium]
MIPPAAVAAISAAILAYEVLLVRLFAIVQWHHFAFMAISVALLGFGVSGALLALARTWAARHASSLFVLGAALFAVTAPGAFLLAQLVPFNALEVVWAPGELFELGLIYLLLLVPFTAGATCIGLAFLVSAASPGRVYLWNLLGSGAGALAAIGALALLPPMACLAASGAIALAAALLCALANRLAEALVTLALLGLAGPLFWLTAPAPWITLHVSPLKGLPRALAVEDARLLGTYSSPLAMLSVVESPTAPFRVAPGLSLTAPALPPPQVGIFADGEFATAIDLWDGRADSLTYLAHTADALAYQLVDRPEVLVLGAGGGRLVLQALFHDAARIDAVERNGQMLRLLSRDLAERTGGLYARATIRAVRADPRHFVTVTGRKWDLIHLPLIGSGRGGAVR